MSSATTADTADRRSVVAQRGGNVGVLDTMLCSIGGPWVPWRQAWEAALYGPSGFYRRNRPADHFTTSAHVGTGLATAIRTLARRLGVDHVVDVGSGSGELLGTLRALDPDLVLTAVELRERSAVVPPDLAWVQALPDALDALVVANEYLDNIACPVVQLDEHGTVRMVEVNPAGVERLGAPADQDSVDWLARWWPLTDTGDRAEVGLSRDQAWADVVIRLGHGAAVAIDYGHQLAHRPVGGTLTSYRNGRQTAPTPDGRHDLTAHVAVDSVAANVDAAVRTQREMLKDLGLSGVRPPRQLATSDPAAYVRELSAASQVADLTASPGLGDFFWILSTSHPVDRHEPSAQGALLRPCRPTAPTRGLPAGRAPWE